MQPIQVSLASAASEAKKSTAAIISTLKPYGIADKFEQEGRAVVLLDEAVKFKDIKLIKAALKAKGFYNVSSVDMEGPGGLVVKIGKSVDHKKQYEVSFWAGSIRANLVKGSLSKIGVK